VFLLFSCLVDWIAECATLQAIQLNNQTTKQLNNKAQVELAHFLLFGVFVV